MGGALPTADVEAHPAGQCSGGPPSWWRGVRSISYGSSGAGCRAAPRLGRRWADWLTRLPDDRRPRDSRREPSCGARRRRRHAGRHRGILLDRLDVLRAVVVLSHLK